MNKFIHGGLLLFALFFFFDLFPSGVAATSSLIMSIDCGSSNRHTDNLGISWISDSSLIKTGEPETVPDAASFSQPMQTLRVFPTGKRNCYTLSIPSDGQVLVRASFLYGNYDGKNSPPTFDLEFDGNKWSTVETSVDAVVSHEVIYVVSGKSTSVCVVQTKVGDRPFVSAIEVRRLEDSMYKYYDRRSSALVLSMRKVVGVGSAIRYPYDTYDRIWYPFESPKTVDVVRNQATAIDTGISDRPPAAIFQAAVTTISGFNSVSFTVDTYPSNPINAYINMYFTEVTPVAAGDNRAFQISVDTAVASKPLVPTFGGIIEAYITEFLASNSTKFQLQPAAGATLPPAISAMEAYVIVDLAAGGGDPTPVPGDGGSPPFTDPSTKIPGNGSPNDAIPQASGREDSIPAVQSVPAVQNFPAGSAFGAGKKEIPSFGNKKDVGRFGEIGVGIIIHILFLNFV